MERTQKRKRGSGARRDLTEAYQGPKTGMQEAKQTSSSVLPDAEGYDVSELAEKNGVRCKTKQQREKLMPKESVTLHGITGTAKRNNVQSKNDDGNLQKKQKKSSKKNGTVANVARQEMKLFIAKQVFMEGENSGAGDALTGIFRSVVRNGFQRFGKRVLKQTGRLLIWTVSLLLRFLVAFFSLLLPILLPVILLLLAVVLIAELAAVMIGFLLDASATAQSDFAVTIINDHKAAIMEEAEAYAGTVYDGKEVEEVVIRYSCITDIDSNSDDMLLAYMVTASRDQQVLEDGSQAPLLLVNTSGEQEAMAAVLQDMLFIKSISYEERTREIIVTVTPTPEPSKTPTLPAAVTPTPEATATPGAPAAQVTPMAPAAPATAPQGAVTPVPSETPTPSVTPAPEVTVITETYYAAIVVIEGSDAALWLQNHVINDSVATFFTQMFRSFGYIPMGGDSVCSRYAEAAIR